MRTWNGVVFQLMTLEPGTAIPVPATVAHPAACGARASVGLPIGQRADYRWVLPDCSGLHVREYPDGTLDAHIDRVDPSCGPVEHLRQDAPGLFVGICAALGAAAGAYFGGNARSAIAGAVLAAGTAGLSLPQR